MNIALRHLLSEGAACSSMALFDSTTAVLYYIVDQPASSVVLLEVTGSCELASLCCS